MQASPEPMVEVVADSAALVDASSAELKTSFSSDVINSFPVGQDYRDLVKLIPGVMYTQDAVRGPSAGGSGQDNVHQFDGVNVNLPLFGTMSSDALGPRHRSGHHPQGRRGRHRLQPLRGLHHQLRSASPAPTSSQGELSYQILPDNLVAKRDATTAAVYEQEKTYAILNVGGPILQGQALLLCLSLPSHREPAEQRQPLRPDSRTCHDTATNTSAN